MPQINPLPGESLRAYQRRVTAAARMALQAQPKGYNQVSEKRKEYLQKKAEHKRTKKIQEKYGVVGELSEMGAGQGGRSVREAMEEVQQLERRLWGSGAHQTDVKFGERVEAPPRLSVRPKRTKASQAPAGKDSLLLRSHWQESGIGRAEAGGVEEEEGEEDERKAQEERAEAFRRAKQEQLRTEAIRAYTALKQRKRAAAKAAEDAKEKKKAKMRKKAAKKQSVPGLKA